MDSGSTHNFLSEYTTQMLGCPIKKVERVQVTVANGQDLQCKGWWEGLDIRVQGQAVTVDAYTLPLESSNLILGAQWLVGLGDIIWNFKTLTIRFFIGKQKYFLQGYKDMQVSCIKEE